MKSYLTVAVFLVATLLAVKGEEPLKTVEQLKTEFRELGFGMFIHFNMATYHGEQWVEGYPSPSTFAPGVETIDTDAWADAAKTAGMKYAVLTTKHVSGFCLWDSKYTTYDVMHPDSPYQKDLVDQFVKSFTSRGIKVGFYYCWRHPGFAERFKVLPPECDPANHTMEEQIAFQKKQIIELLEKYPECFYFWHDGYDDKVGTADELLTALRAVRPGVVHAGNWWDWDKKGTPYLDIALKEMRDIAEDNTAIAETCWTLEDKWFWIPGTKTRETETLLERMATADARNSNFLINVGPDRMGEILPTSVEALKQIGESVLAQESQP